ncbi:hypothetical protein B0A50_06241 [Salinomyces thailandicus]|uniref:Transcription factor spt8 beta-propeller domain-containing protein n=1 Tax=Salinomyces thailandicus TaxID=706561 RepID=A0A4U0TT76_9PEZI|nr:hypothetical protein B0A50_06241 [Salinomyces thailandica]
MADFDDADPTAEDEFENENEDEEMEDANDEEQDGDQDQDQDDDQGDDNDDEDEGDEGDDNDNEDDEDDNEDQDNDHPDSPSRRADQPAQHPPQDSTAEQSQQNPSVVLTSPSPRPPRSPKDRIVTSYYPPPRPEALAAQAYDIAPTMAAPQSTSINAIAATPDSRFVFSGGSDGYVRMYNWVETANGKVPLTVAQKHPFVDSVMKGGSLVTYWENEEVYSGGGFRTPTRNDEDGKWTSPVYSLAVQHQAVWLLSGLESGGINLQTCRHQAGTRITTLKEHTSSVSVLTLSRDETSLLSGSWDKSILDWDLNTGKVKRSFKGSGSQISAVETRPESSVPVPDVVPETIQEPANGTFSSNNAEDPRANSDALNGFPADLDKGGEEDAAGSPDGSLFGENDHGSLFGEDNTGGGGNAFGEDDDEMAKALADSLQEQNVPGDEDTEMGGVGMGSGGPVQPPDSTAQTQAETSNGQLNPQNDDYTRPPSQPTEASSNPTANGLPHADEPLTAPPTNDSTLPPPTTGDLPPQSESTFLSAAIDGTLRIWDRRTAHPIATLPPSPNTPPWCTGACWSPDGNTFYAGRRNNTVDEYSLHHLSRTRTGHNPEPTRQFKFQAGSGPVYAVRAMPNGRHLVCASQDILRIYDLQHSTEGSRRSTVPFTIVPGHRGGVISLIYVDPACRFMLSAAGNRGWEGNGTEVLLGYEIGAQDAGGVWHK